MFQDKEVIKILSIDGGGIRGFIPGLLLSEIEKCTGKKVHELFDFFSGTSTGGILSLLLNRPEPTPASNLLDIYLGEDGHKIFKKNVLTPLNYIFRGEKYNKKGIEEVLGRRLEDYCLKDSLKPVLITSYETEARNATFFTSYDSRYNDMQMKDIARSTSAAPTYFEPYEIKDKGTFIDGGIAVNNPAMCAYVEVLKLLKKEGIDPATKKIVVVSLGTGVATSSLYYKDIKNWSPLAWIKGPLIGSFFDGNSDTVEYQLKQILPPDCYFRFQLKLPSEKGADKLDNTNEECLNKIKALTMQYIQHDNVKGLPLGWRSKLQTLCHMIQPESLVNQ